MRYFFQVTHSSRSGEERDMELDATIEAKLKSGADVRVLHRIVYEGMCALTDLDTSIEHTANGNTAKVLIRAVKAAATTKFNAPRIELIDSKEDEIAPTEHNAFILIHVFVSDNGLEVQQYMWDLAREDIPMPKDYRLQEYLRILMYNQIAGIGPHDHAGMRALVAWETKVLKRRHRSWVESIVRETAHA